VRCGSWLLGGLLIGSLGRGEGEVRKCVYSTIYNVSQVLNVQSNRTHIFELVFESSRRCDSKRIGVGGNVLKINTYITRMLNRGGN
jgi:hypothetical protein